METTEGAASTVPRCLLDLHLTGRLDLHVFQVLVHVVTVVRVEHIITKLIGRGALCVQRVSTVRQPPVLAANLRVPTPMEQKCLLDLRLPPIYVRVETVAARWVNCVRLPAIYVSHLRAQTRMGQKCLLDSKMLAKLLVDS